MFTYESVHYSKLNLITYKAQPFLSVIPAEAVSLGDDTSGHLSFVCLIRVLRLKYVTLAEFHT